MQVMGAQLRKIGFKQGLLSMAMSLAFTAGWAVALHSFGRDPWEALKMFVPVFFGALVANAGINPVRSPQLFALVLAGAAGVMMIVEWATKL